MPPVLPSHRRRPKLIRLHSASKKQQGDSAPQGGKPTRREPHEKQKDDPLTTNDESNDQPLLHYGKVTMYVRNISSGNSYYLDADLDDKHNLTRLYFPKGGWVDFLDGCELDADRSGICIDENGKKWNIQGDF